MDLTSLSNLQLVECPGGCGPASHLHFDEAVFLDSSATVIDSAAVDGGLGLDLPVPRKNHMLALPGFCDACGTQFVLGLEQHKGQTFVQLHTDHPPYTY